MNLNLTLDFITELADTETDHLGWRELCGKLGQVVELIVEDVCVDIVTRDTAQVSVNSLIREQAGAELGQAQVMLDDIIEVVVEFCS